MDGQTTAFKETRSSAWRVELAMFAVLLLVAAGIHAWLIRHTEVMARDGVGFIAYSWQLRSQPWDQVVRDNQHPPFYPLTILGMSYPLRPWLSGDENEVMQKSAQWTSALAGMLLVIPMFYLGRALFDPRVGFWAALLFQCWPVGSRLLADALTEGVFLLLVMTALLCAIHALRKSRAIYFGLSGLCGGLAYLTRPEGAVVVAATLVVLVGMQVFRAYRRPWRQAITACATVIVAAVAAGGPYAFTIGHFSNKTTSHEIMQTAKIEPSETPQTIAPTSASLLGVFGPDSRELGFVKHHLWCLAAVFREVMKGYHYVAWFWALVGIFWFRAHLRERPGAWVLLALMVLQLLILWRVAFVMGYVAERHSVLIVTCGLYWAVATIGAIGDWLALMAGRYLARRQLVAAVFLLSLALSGLPKTLEPLHTNRAGFHAAGRWLAERLQPGDQIYDPFNWVEYYSGQVYRISNRFAPPLGRHPQYVVLGGTENEHKRLPLMPAATFWATQGTLVYEWPTTPVHAKAESVRVYQVTK
jgi:hypothetical protein